MPETILRVGLAGDDEAHAELAERLVRGVRPPTSGTDSFELRFGPAGKRTLLRLKDTAPSTDDRRPHYTKQRFADGLPMAYAAVPHRAAQILLNNQGHDVAVVLCDGDGDPARSTLIQRLQAEWDAQFPRQSAFGVAVPCAEAWVITLVGPQRDKERKQLRSDLGHDVVARPDHLSHAPGSLSHPKRVVRFLLDEGRTALEDCSQGTVPLADLQSLLEEVDLSEVLSKPMSDALQRCGLADFYAALRRLVPPTSAS